VNMGKWYVLVYQGVVTMFVLMNFSLATFMDPGVIPRAKSNEDREDDFRLLYTEVLTLMELQLE